MVKTNRSNCMQETEVTVLNDSEIVKLFFARDEESIAQSEQKYGALCRSVIRHILPDERDTEECLNDVWSRAWNSIPPEEPRSLSAFLSRIARNLALDRFLYNRAGKRSTALTEAFDELENYLIGADDAQRAAEEDEFREWLRAFLDAQSRENRTFFVRRYWYGESMSEIARATGASEEKIKSSLFRTRNRLREAMKKEGIAL